MGQKMPQPKAVAFTAPAVPTLDLGVVTADFLFVIRGRGLL